MDEAPGHGRMAPQHGVVPADVVLRPVRRLESAYRETADLVERLAAGLDSLAADLAAGAGVRTAAVAAVPVPVEADRIAKLRKDVAGLPGVTEVVVAGSSDGVTRLLVQLGGDDRAEPVEPRVVCIECGRVVVDGDLPASHGLCPECVDRFVRGAGRD
ncbi:MAG: hypothetical protein IT303_18675 [Dehalococcoidia bacterium]|nr:hypothetical protein [Dehalococcoidia bacterium]